MMAAFNVENISQAKEPRPSNPDTLILKQLQEHIVMNTELKEKIKAL